MYREESRGDVWGITCRHPEDRIEVSLANTLLCTLCGEKVQDYEVFRTDADRDI